MAALDLAYESQRSLARLRPRIQERVMASRHPAFPPDILIEILEKRLEERWAPFFLLLHRLYGKHYDFFYYLEKITLTAIESWVNRPDPMMEQDRRREFDPQWYLSQEMVGMSLYVDLFSGDLGRLKARIPYLRELGITYLHLMPLFASPPGNNDGGYAVSDYRTVDPRLGTIADLKSLSAGLREAGISLVLDFVFNHTADDHPWALRAREGERAFRDYYLTFPDRTMPDRYEENLREIFPTVRRGNFTWHDGMKRWVWTTFNSFQWDLNYANPEVFCAMAGELLFLANCGVEILRLDAVAFIWKQLGTSCENLPEAHLVIQAFNSLCRIAAPGLVFKSEAIVHPDEVVKYIKPEECQLSYNPTMMALLWEACATRDIRLLRETLETRQAIPQKTIWVNYLRGHDDIGWSFDNGDAWSVGINPEDHRDLSQPVLHRGVSRCTLPGGCPFSITRTPAICASPGRWPPWPASSKEWSSSRRTSWRWRCAGCGCSMACSSARVGSPCSSWAKSGAGSTTTPLRTTRRKQMTAAGSTGSRWTGTAVSSASSRGGPFAPHLSRDPETDPVAQGLSRPERLRFAGPPYQ
jgi:amylosucrase